jgi:hypothetical protein
MRLISDENARSQLLQLAGARDDDAFWQLLERSRENFSTYRVESHDPATPAEPLLSYERFRIQAAKSVRYKTKHLSAGCHCCRRKRRIRISGLFRMRSRGCSEHPRSIDLALYCAPLMRSTSAICQRALLSFISSSMPLIARLLGIRLPSGRRRE